MNPAPLFTLPDATFITLPHASCMARCVLKAPSVIDLFKRRAYRTIGHIGKNLLSYILWKCFSLPTVGKKYVRVFNKNSVCGMFTKMVNLIHTHNPLGKKSTMVLAIVSFLDYPGNIVV